MPNKTFDSQMAVMAGNILDLEVLAGNVIGTNPGQAQQLIQKANDLRAQREAVKLNRAKFLLSDPEWLSLATSLDALTGEIKAASKSLNRVAEVITVAATVIAAAATVATMI